MPPTLSPMKTPTTVDQSPAAMNEGHARARACGSSRDRRLVDGVEQGIEQVREHQRDDEDEERLADEVDEAHR
jgi:hypothetical protein